MNVILFAKEEWGKPLASRDHRAIHIREILRLTPGDTFRVGLLDVGVGTARLVSIDLATVEVDFPAIGDLRAEGDSVPICLILGHPRPLVLQRLFKDINAMGIERAILVASDLGEKSYLEANMWKDGSVEKYLIQGAQQGGIATLCRVERSQSLRKTLSELDPVAQRIVLDLGQGESFLSWCARSQGPAGPLCLAVGSERGWSERERSMFRDAGFASMSLGRRVLRTEAAVQLACGMAALALDSAS